MTLSERLKRKQQQDTAAQVRDSAAWLRLAAERLDDGDRDAATAMIGLARVGLDGSTERLSRLA